MGLVDVFAAALALIALALSMWIVIPGPIPALFILTVGGEELWPVLTLFDAIALAAALRSRTAMRVPAAVVSSLALACTLVPPIAYAVKGPYVPLSVLLSLSPMRGPVNHLASNAPVVFAIYGGAWERGSPANDAHLNAIIRSWGYRVIALQYPHAPRSHWPAQLDAILAQIDAAHAPRVALLGHSSGAQLAMIAAALRPHRIKAVVTYESPVDLALAYEYPPRPDIIDVRRIMTDLCGGTPAQQPACYRSASPRYAVRRGMPPVLLIAAGRDHIVNLQFESVLRDRLRREGVRVEYVELPWTDHAFEIVYAGFHNRIALWYVHRFLERTLQNGER